ncbi:MULTISPECIES: hypothetical protein [Thermoanaerobacterium]|uniref:Uncharacterized protein n=2 Tax=Thermoanaerobacterium TaxID=28895 RepID=W9E8A3_9THEO|nr:MULTISPECIES: hypothetical protein [Thermoanaerobacterium]AFK85506.1 hypothetical protein Tsac_0480 [Thermoanaerobacterium saccharolyticum JW/SL-YS485]ETO37186.1 hypothetical protein V518_2663 [Thermoanaerobacterium aotearoense SCUT27]
MSNIAVNNKKIILELDDIYYNIDDLLEALIKHYKNKGVKCEKLYNDKVGNPVLLVDSKKYVVSVKNVGPNLVQYTLPPGTVWPTFISVQQIILKHDI